MKTWFSSFVLFLTFVFFLAAGQSQAWALGWRQAKVVSPDGEIKSIEWNEWELTKDPVKRDVGKSETASYHIIRLQGVEPEHTHDTHDLVATVLKGTGKIHFKDQTFSLQKGDVAHIPAGIPHWVENTGRDAFEAYAVFSPPFDGKDFHLTESGRESASRPEQPMYENI